MAGQQDRPLAAEKVTGDLTQRLERLPPGHPSSPYNDDGTRKPPVPRLADRELPLPDEQPADGGLDSPDTEEPSQRSLDTNDLTEEPPASPEPPGRDTAGQEFRDGETSENEAPSGGVKEREARVAEQPSPEAAAPDSRSWGDSLSHFKEQWERHKERWPQEQRPPVDRSTDEPDSWRGEGDQYLNAEENLVAEHSLEHIRPVEEKVSATLHEVREEVPGCDLVGLKFSLKGEERFKEKVSDELRAKPERSIAVISENMPDAVRYTFQFDRKNYVDGYWNTLGCMERHGYEMELSRNSWDSSQYKGINTRWRTPTGQLFEVQFHTPESFEAKQLTHVAYERIRSPAASDQERGELYEFQSEVSASIPVPADSRTIADNPKKEV